MMIVKETNAKVVIEIAGCIITCVHMLLTNNVIAWETQHFKENQYKKQSASGFYPPKNYGKILKNTTKVYLNFDDFILAMEHTKQ